MSLNLDLDFTQQQHKMQTVLNILKLTTKQFIIIDGVIGSGKTTLIKSIEDYINNNNNNNNNNDTASNASNASNASEVSTTKVLKVKAIYEPVNMWTSTGVLQYFYEDIKNNCYEFQTYTYITRIQSVINEIYDNPDADVYILERSIWTDRYIFMELLKNDIGDLRMTMYNQWCDMWALILPMRVDKWVFLDTSITESLSRITKRNRESEDSISIDYQTKLYDKHIEFYNTLKQCGQPTITINNILMNDDFINNKNVLKNIINQILH